MYASLTWKLIWTDSGLMDYFLLKVTDNLFVNIILSSIIPFTPITLSEFIFNWINLISLTYYNTNINLKLGDVVLTNLLMLALSQLAILAIIVFLIIIY